MYSFSELYIEIQNSKNLEEFCKKFGGHKIYIPKVRPNYREKILEEYNGYNEARLATKYNLSISTIYNIVRETKIKQKTLF